MTTSTWTLQELIIHIVEKHHAYLREELPFLEQRLAKMCANHGEERPELFSIQQALQDLRDDLTLHMAKEENVLFPAIVRMDQAALAGLEKPPTPFASVRFPVRMMVSEHDAAEQLLRILRAATSDYEAPKHLCDCGREFYTRLRTLDEDLTEHIRLENEELFPQAIDLEERSR